MATADQRAAELVRVEQHDGDAWFVTVARAVVFESDRHIEADQVARQWKRTLSAELAAAEARGAERERGRCASRLAEQAEELERMSAGHPNSDGLLAQSMALAEAAAEIREGGGR